MQYKDSFMCSALQNAAQLRYKWGTNVVKRSTLASLQTPLVSLP